MSFTYFLILNKEIPYNKVIDNITESSKIKCIKHDFINNCYVIVSELYSDQYLLNIIKNTLSLLKLEYPDLKYIFSQKVVKTQVDPDSMGLII